MRAILDLRCGNCEETSGSAGKRMPRIAVNHDGPDVAGTVDEDRHFPHHQSR